MGKCVSELNKQNLQLPIHIKCYNEGKLTKTIYSGVFEYQSDDDIGTYFNIKCIANTNVTVKGIWHPLELCRGKFTQNR